MDANIHGITNLQMKAVIPSAFIGKRSAPINDLKSLRLDLSGGASVDSEEGSVNANTDAVATIADEEPVLTEEGGEEEAVEETQAVDVSAKEKIIRGGATKVLTPGEEEEDEESASVESEMIVTALPVSKPIRITTNENGHQVVTEDIVSTKLTRKEKRLARKKKNREEKSHRKYAKKLKVSELFVSALGFVYLCIDIHNTISMY